MSHDFYRSLEWMLNQLKTEQITNVTLQNDGQPGPAHKSSVVEIETASGRRFIVGTSAEELAPTVEPRD